MNLASTPETIELELKFGLRECGVDQVSLALKDLLQRDIHAQPDTLKNTYYDYQGVLHEHGVAIRTRSVGNRHEMTVKVRRAAESGLSRRGEWNIRILEPVLDYGALDELSLPDPVRTVIKNRSLDPVFGNVFERTDWRVTQPDCDLMLSLDRGSVRVDNRESPVSELELELISGDLNRMIEFGCQLVDLLPSFMAVISKAERGDRLIRSAHPMQDLKPRQKEDWLNWLSRALDPLSGPAPDEAYLALEELGEPEALVMFGEPVARGELPLGLARWMVELSLESMRGTD
jgi:inorganic triphosphatase YgiF